VFGPNKPLSTKQVCACKVCPGLKREFLRRQGKWIDTRKITD
jgi:hypothetical protein